MKDVLSENTVDAFGKVGFVNQLHFIRSLAGLVVPRDAHDQPRLAAIQCKVDELLGQIDHDGIDTITCSCVKETPQEKSRREAEEVYRDYYLERFGKEPPPIESMNPIQKQNFTQFKDGYNAN